MPWNDQRPMSPHLQIYRLPLTALLSVLHRATGAALFLAMLIMVLVLLALASGEKYWTVMHNILSSWFGLIVLIAMTFSLYYHLCTGIRHMIWDLGLAMEKHSLKKSGVLVLFSSVFLTLITWLIAYQ
ncbi:MAG: succinate dehydrogenase, cytochrome b556 subunit [Proteobacteria bacterium]|nr:succinate dehydrogenase, cytochrome b556 subunit [Pseudomonadota bacterium]